MKRLTALLLALTILLTTLAGCQSQETTSSSGPENSAFSEVVSSEPEAASEPGPVGQIETIMAGELPYDEYKRGIWYGFLPEELDGADPAEAVTWAQYCKIIENLVALQDSDALPVWKELEKFAGTSNEIMKRDQGIFVLYQAMELLGLDENAVDDLAILPLVDENDLIFAFDEYTFDYSAFVGPDADASGYWEISVDDGTRTEPYIMWAVKMCYGRLSKDFFEPIYRNDAHMNEDLTLLEAMLSVVRLYESQVEVARELWMGWRDRMLEQVGNEEAQEVTQRREQILSSQTTIQKGDIFIPGETFSGTAYYVSNDGSDENDGRTPETAWKSLEKVRNYPLQTGDAVFFERGGFYRGYLSPYNWGREITLSAYGNGPKPVITSSMENAASEEKWELFSEKDGKKIWKYYRDMSDCGAIFFDDSRAANKILAKWDGTAWSNEDGSPFSVTEALGQDLDFFNDDGGWFHGEMTYTISGGETQDDIAYGPLYLRCDAGNPGLLFEDIEIGEIADQQGSAGELVTCPVEVEAGTVVDNLSIKYYANYGIVPNADNLIQNCEFAWGGGCVQIVQDGIAVGRAGDALVGVDAVNIKVCNNYFHDIAGGAQDLESYDDQHGKVSGYVFTGNLVEGALGWNMTYENAEIDGLEISYNIFTRSGLSWSGEMMLRWRNIWEGEWFKDIRIRTKNTILNDITIQNNAFYDSLQFMLYLGFNDPEYRPNMSDNRYYLRECTPLFAYCQTSTLPGLYNSIEADESESFLRDFLKDETSIVLLEGEKIPERQGLDFQETVSSALPTDSTPEPVGDPIPADEYERGVWRGFLPEELEGADPDATNLTWKQFDEMLGRMIGKYRPEKAEEWAELTQDAPDREVKRDGAAMALLYAAELVDLLGVREEPFETPNSFFTNESLDYGGFDVTKPISVDGPRGWINSDNLDGGRIEPAMLFAALHDSQVTGKPLMEIPEDGMFHAWGSVSLRDGMIAVVRLLESDGAVADNAKEQFGQS